MGGIFEALLAMIGFGERASHAWLADGVGQSAVLRDLYGQRDHSVPMSLPLREGRDGLPRLRHLLFEPTLFLLEQWQRDGIYVVRLKEFQLLGFEFSEADRGSLGFGLDALPLFAEVVEQPAADPRRVLDGEVDASVVVDDGPFDLFDGQGGLLAAIAPLSAGAGIVGVQAAALAVGD